MKSQACRLILAVLLAGTVLLWALPVAVGATQPFRVPFPAQDFDYDSSCGFPVLYEVLQDNGYWTTFFDAQGNEVKWLLNGILKVRLTNLESGRSVEVNIGPCQLTPDQGNIWTYSCWGSGWWDWGQTPPSGLPNLMSCSGQVTVKLDVSTGTVTEFVSMHGRVVDLCATLE